MGYTNVRSIRDDGGLHEVGAVGLAGGDGRETITGTGDLTSAVVTTAVTITGLNGASDGSGDERQNNGGLHFDVWVDKEFLCLI